MTDLLKQLDAAAELGKKATERPWATSNSENMVLSKDGSRYVHKPTGYIPEIFVMGDGETGYMTPETANYITAACSLDHAAIAAELRAKDAEIERLREALRNIADVPACSPDGQLYYEISSEDGQTGVMPVDPIGWIQDAANKARAALTPAAGADHA